MRKHSENFLVSARFYLKFYRNVSDFAGVNIVINYDKKGEDALTVFKEYENGLYKIKPIITKHPNLLKSLIGGKKAWGLQLNQWAEGVSQSLFSPKDILDGVNIHIPTSFLGDFYTRCYQYSLKQDSTFFLNLK